MAVPVPVPRREVAELLGEPGGRPLPLLRLPEVAATPSRFVREIEHLDFVGAVEWLAAKAGITLRYTDAGEGETRRKRNRLLEVMAAAVDWYHDRLLTGPDAGAGPRLPAQPRPRRRRRARTTASAGRRRRGTSWSRRCGPEVRRRRARRVPGSASATAAAGPPTPSGAGVLFPIFDAEGHAGRLRRAHPPRRRRPEVQELAGDGALLQEPGALRPQLAQERDRQRRRERRGHRVRGLHRRDRLRPGRRPAGRRHVRHRAHRGAREAAARGSPSGSCSPSTPTPPARAPPTRSRRGSSATSSRSASPTCPPAPIPATSPSATPTGCGPPSTASTSGGPGTAGAKPYLAFRLDRVLAGADLRSVEGRARAAAAGVEVLRDHPNELVRDAYLMKLADHCRVDAGAAPRASCGGAPRRRRDRAGARRRRAAAVAPGAPATRRSVEALIAARAPARRDGAVARRQLFVDDRNLAVFWALLGRARRRRRPRAAAGDRPRGGRGAGRGRGRRTPKPSPTTSVRCLLELPAAERRSASSRRRGPARRGSSRAERRDRSPQARDRRAARARRPGRRGRRRCSPRCGVRRRRSQGRPSGCYPGLRSREQGRGMTNHRRTAGRPTRMGARRRD